MNRRLFATLAVPLAAACGAPEPASIGVVMGSEGHWGAMLAAEQINAEGGIAGDSLRLQLIFDAASVSAQAAIQAAERFADDRSVLAVVGHPNSAASLAASQVYNDRRLMHITPTSTAPLLSEAGPYTFRLVPSDARQAVFLAEHLLSTSNDVRVALTFVNDDYGRGLAQALRGELAERGIVPVYEAAFNHGPDAERFEPMARSIADSHVTHLLWVGRAGELALLLPQVRARAPDVMVLASDGVDQAYVYQNADGVFTGMCYVRFLDLDAPGPLSDLRARVRARFGQELLTSQGALSSAAVLLRAAAWRAGARDREAVRAYVASIGRERPPFAGVVGPIAFDERGDVDRPHSLATVTPQGVVTATPEACRPGPRRSAGAAP